MSQLDRDPDNFDHQRDDYDPDRTPGVVIAAVAGATVVVPFLIVYAFLFIARGIFVTPEQPDITSSRHGEAISGFIVLIFLAVVLWGMSRLLNGSSRIPFWIGQLITAATAGYLLLDTSSGEPQIPIVVFIGAVLALALSVTPSATRWVRGLPADADEGDDSDELLTPAPQQG